MRARYAAELRQKVYNCRLMLVPLSGSDDGRDQSLEAVNARDDTIAAHQWADARRRTREYQVTRLQLVIRRQLGDDFRDAPDQLRDVRVLSGLPIHLEPDPASRGMTDLGGRLDRADGRRSIEAFRDFPGQSLRFQIRLQIASRQVVADRVAEHVVERRGQWDVATLLADGYH